MLGYTPICSYVSRHKVTNKLILCVGSDDGHVIVVSIEKEDAGREIFKKMVI